MERANVDAFPQGRRQQRELIDGLETGKADERRCPLTRPGFAGAVFFIFVLHGLAALVEAAPGRLRAGCISGNFHPKATATDQFTSIASPFSKVKAAGTCT